MKLSRKISLCALTALILNCGTASADVIVQLKQTFKSGAAFQGALTFSDNYASLIDVDGYLSGGKYGNSHLTWTWKESVGDSPGNTTNVDGVRNDWLMDGSFERGFDNFIGLSWQYPATALIINMSPNINVYYAGLNNTDRAISATVSQVPEPTSIALIGLGLAGLAGACRRKRS